MFLCFKFSVVFNNIYLLKYYMELVDIILSKKFKIVIFHDYRREKTYGDLHLAHLPRPKTKTTSGIFSNWRWKVQTNILVKLLHTM